MVILPIYRSGGIDRNGFGRTLLFQQSSGAFVIVVFGEEASQFLEIVAFLAGKIA